MQLPEESKKFQIVDKTFKALMRDTHKKPLVLECVANGRKTLTSLQQANAMLEDIQRCLEEYVFCVCAFTFSCGGSRAAASNQDSGRGDRGR